MKKLIQYTLYFTVALVFAACRHQIEPKPVTSIPAKDSPTVTVPIYDSTSCNAVVADFLAGQNTLAGKITINNDLTNIYVKFETVDGWQMSESHLYAGPLKNLPQTPTGNPKIGNFPYKTTHVPAVSSFTYTIPLSSLGENKCIIIAAHAVVNKYNGDGSTLDQQTAWGAGVQFNASGSWATYVPYCTCETGNSGGAVTPGGTGGTVTPGGSGDPVTPGGSGGTVIQGAAPYTGGN